MINVMSDIQTVLETPIQGSTKYAKSTWRHKYKPRRRVVHKLGRPRGNKEPNTITVTVNSEARRLIEALKINPQEPNGDVILKAVRYLVMEKQRKKVQAPDNDLVEDSPEAWTSIWNEVTNKL